jgi:hypothetical protein
MTQRRSVLASFSLNTVQMKPLINRLPRCIEFFSRLRRENVHMQSTFNCMKSIEKPGHYAPPIQCVAYNNSITIHHRQVGDIPNISFAAARSTYCYIFGVRKLKPLRLDLLNK